MKLLEKAKRQGLLTEPQAALCLHELERAEKAGKTLRLVQVLLQKKLLSSTDISNVLRPAEAESAPSDIHETDTAVLAALAPGAPPDPATGERLGDYLLLREIARGGMGTLFEARRHQGAPGRFAVKVLTAAASQSPELIDRFREEARVAATLSHPNIVKIHEVGQDRGRHFLVTDFFDGRSLAELLREGRLSPKKAVSVLATAARAASYMHEKNVVHRDLKPGTILVGKGGNVCIADFGLAKDLARTDPRLASLGLATGTPGYLAPEQARGDINAIGPWTDVYALGACLYRALSGSFPYDASDYMTHVKKISWEQPVSLAKRRPDVPPQLAAIVASAMARDVRSRPRADGLAVLLEQLLVSQRIEMPPAPPNPDV